MFYSFSTAIVLSFLIFYQGLVYSQIIFKIFGCKYFFKNFNYIFTFYFFRLCSILINILKRILYKFKKNNYKSIRIIKMEVILLESLNKLGGIGDLVTVKDGYARNYLILRKSPTRKWWKQRIFLKNKTRLSRKKQKIIEDAQLIVQKISN